MTRRVTYTNPPGAPAPGGLYSNVAIVEPGRMAHIAGQVAMDASGAPVAAGDFGGQVERVFANLEAILASLGAGFDDVAEFTTYVVGAQHLPAWFEARTRVYARIYPAKAYPPNTLLVVDRLVRPDYLLEISAIARLP
ncbi:MAG: RidA family protein [Hyphomicrobiales bacterium]|nr:RidA family protein [Hyphomicrobiales bacterium]